MVEKSISISNSIEFNYCFVFLLRQSYGLPIGPTRTLDVVGAPLHLGEIPCSFTTKPESPYSICSKNIRGYLPLSLFASLHPRPSLPRLHHGFIKISFLAFGVSPTPPRRFRVKC